MAGPEPIPSDLQHGAHSLDRDAPVRRVGRATPVRPVHASWCRRALVTSAPALPFHERVRTAHAGPARVPHVRYGRPSADTSHFRLPLNPSQILAAIGRNGDLGARGSGQSVGRRTNRQAVQGHSAANMRAWCFWMMEEGEPIGYRQGDVWAGSMARTPSKPAWSPGRRASFLAPAGQRGNLGGAVRNRRIRACGSAR